MKFLANLTNWISYDAWIIYFFLVVLSATIFGGYCAIRAVAANGKQDYCYIIESVEPGVNRYELRASIEWRPDLKLGKFFSIEDAKVEAEKLNCQLK